MLLAGEKDRTSSEPLVSVNLIAYNQEHTIRRALESILAQVVDFPIEILLADDASQDGTLQVMLGFQQRYPDIIHVVHQEQNVGPTRNAYAILSRSRGRYIASLEGDDYWCDSQFLQRSADFLEAHDEDIGVQDRCRIVDEEGNDQTANYPPTGNEFWQYHEREYGLAEYQEWRMPGHISALVYRNLFRLEDDDYTIFYRLDSSVGDRTTLMQLVARGKIYCTEHVSLCYQLVEKHGAQNWMSKYRKQNRRFDEWKMICQEEAYLRNHFHKSVDMDHLKRNKLAAAAAIFSLSPSLKNGRPLWQIICYRGHFWRKLRLVLSAIVQKRYFCWRGEPERRIKV